MNKYNKEQESQIVQAVVTNENVIEKTDAEIEQERVAGLKTKLKHRAYFLVGLVVMFTVVIIFAAI